jgi:hypothetical protein
MVVPWRRRYRPVADSQGVTGNYQRSVVLAIGRCAMLDDGMDVPLVPLKPLIEQRLGLTARRRNALWRLVLGD